MSTCMSEELVVELCKRTGDILILDLLARNYYNVNKETLPGDVNDTVKRFTVYIDKLKSKISLDDYELSIDSYMGQCLNKHGVSGWINMLVDICYDGDEPDDEPDNED